MTEQTKIKLVDEISNILKDTGYVNTNTWTQDENVQIGIKSNDLIFERIYINRYWRSVLGNLPQNTAAERYCLVDDGPIEEYLELFKDIVAPTIATIKE